MCYYYNIYSILLFIVCYGLSETFLILHRFMKAVLAEGIEGLDNVAQLEDDIIVAIGADVIRDS